MAFPVLGKPSPAFFDSNGAPLNNGTLTITDPNTLDPKYTYSTAAEADVASGNENLAIIALNQRGEPATEIWGIDGQEYRIELKDSAGTSIWVSTDIAWDFTGVANTEVHIARTAAETAAGITAYVKGVTTMGNIVNPWYRPGNIMRYGADPAYSADSSLALQAAINQFSHEVSGQEAAPFVPRGRYKLSSDVYCFYSASVAATAGHNTNARSFRPYIIGEGRGTANNASNGDSNGCSVLQLDQDVTLWVCDADSATSYTSYSTRGFRLVDFALWGTPVNDPMLQWYGTRAGEARMVVASFGTGTAVAMGNMCCNSQLDLAISQTSGVVQGTGLTYDSTGAGGGIIDWRMLLTNFEYPATFGGAEAAANLRVDTWKFHTFDIEGNDNPVWFKEIFGDVEMHVHSEGNIRGSLKFTDAGIHEGSITIRGHFGITNAANGGIANHAEIQLGETGGTDSANSHGNIFIDRPIVSFLPSNMCFLRRYNSPDNGVLKIDEPKVHANGGAFLVLEDAPQIAEVIIDGTDGLNQIANNVSAALQVSDDTIGTTNLRKYVTFWNTGHIDDFDTAGSDPAAGTADYDYSTASKMPAELLTRVGQGASSTDIVRIILPSDATNIRPFNTVIQRWNTVTTSYVQLEVTAGLINGSASNLLISGAHTAIHINQRTSRGSPRYEVTVRPIQVPNSTPASYADVKAILIAAGIMSA